MLDHEDRHLRLSAACGVCLIGVADPDLLDYLVRRLIDRLHDDATRAEAVFAFEYLATQFPEEVDETLQEIREESDRDPLAYARKGGFRRSNIYNPTPGNRDVGRTRMAGEGQTAGPQQVYTDDADVEAERRLRDTDEESADQADGETTAEDTDATDSDTRGSDAEQTEPDLSDDSVPTGAINSMVDGSVFDDVTIRAIGTPSRYADRYRLLGIVRGQERAVDLRVFHRPQGGGQDFRRRLDQALEDWSIVTHQNVVSIYDFDHDPYPWVATELAESTLEERGALSQSQAIWNATQIASGLSTLHENNIVHGGIEPRAVAYSEISEEGSEYSKPLVDDIGLVEPYRFPHRPETYLDPRYAAPEYFDPTYGTIDHSTDIYQFGSVCYRLFAGRPPFDVDPTDAGPHVLESLPPPPSEVHETIPTLVDSVIQKAMAKRKLTRYESISQMEQDLLRVGNYLENDD